MFPVTLFGPDARTGSSDPVNAKMQKDVVAQVDAGDIKPVRTDSIKIERRSPNLMNRPKCSDLLLPLNPTTSGKAAFSLQNRMVGRKDIPTLA